MEDLTKKRDESIVNLFKDGMMQADIARMFGLTRQRVGQLLKIGLTPAQFARLRKLRIKKSAQDNAKAYLDKRITLK